MKNSQNHPPIIEHTFAIFERVVANVPPLLPKDIYEDMNNALEQLRSNYSLTLDELEDTMIVFGKKVWPYIQAFEELYNVYHGELGEKVFLQKASPSLRRSFEVYLAQGGTWRDLYRGATTAQFNNTEREELHELLVDVRCDIRAFAEQAVLHTDRSRYERRIDEFKHILDDMEHRLDGLRSLAESEAEHPQLVAEIREQIRGFEYGLAFLGPQVDYEAVCNAHTHFTGRKEVLKLF